MNTFKHSGDVGDLIYALPTIRALGGGRLYLATSHFTRVPMSGETMKNIADLFESQPYVHGVEQWHNEKIDYDLDKFRDGWDTCDNIAAQHLKTFGLPLTHLDTPWIEVRPTPIAKVIINRTSRYHNSLFPWKQVMQKYMRDAMFAGFQEEHASFVKKFGVIGFARTRTLLDLAKIIAGCQLFIGNQSTPFALAEALKKPVIQEVFLHTPNCIFSRPGAQFVTGAIIDLPTV